MQKMLVQQEQYVYESKESYYLAYNMRQQSKFNILYFWLCILLDVNINSVLIQSNDEYEFLLQEKIKIMRDSTQIGISSEH